jgi:hypothetical protein
MKNEKSSGLLTKIYAKLNIFVSDFRRKNCLMFLIYILLYFQECIDQARTEKYGEEQSPF